VNDEVDTIAALPGYSTVSPTGSLVAVFPHEQPRGADIDLWDVSVGRRVAALPGVTGNIAFNAEGTTAVMGAKSPVRADGDRLAQSVPRPHPWRCASTIWCPSPRTG
jgi:hypothetical protein